MAPVQKKLEFVKKIYILYDMKPLLILIINFIILAFISCKSTNVQMKEVSEHHNKETKEVVAEKPNGSVGTYNIEPEKTTDSEGNTKYILGIVLKADVEEGIIPSLEYAFKEGCAIFKQMFVVLGSLFTGGVEINQLSGPVGIYSIVDQMSEQGIAALLYLTALLSINVGVINLLPFPAFDGGRILFLIIEKIKGSPVSPKVENTIHSIGFILIILLMIYVTFNDILKLF